LSIARFTKLIAQPAAEKLETCTPKLETNRVSEPSLLLLIPAYNEEARIEPVLRDYAAFFQKNYPHPGRFRIVVVLNGCRDNTLGVVRRVAQDFPAVGWLDFPAPIGKGGALIEGLKFAGHDDLIGYVDADGATGPQAFLDLFRHIGDADCVIGSRWLPGSVLRKAQPTLRRFVSRCFHLIVEFFFWLHVKDTQCPCKLMRCEAVKKIHSSLCIADLAFDVNLLVCLKRAGFKIVEVPIEWTDMIGSKVTASLFRSSLTMFLSVLRIRLIYSPFYKWLKPLRPLEGWVYTKLRAPRPLSSSETQKQKRG
jgi:glycosyltransferase involved in cell wall biosynthesis